ncbi:MAG: hypothetical protein LBF71_00675 [Campylobacteraceae bacterium]|jgi:hypothetical protein|nr:hypothetical protein [Campylobacteraceae bacterium]
MKILKYVLYTILFLYVAVIFLPKENFYFFAEHKLNERKIILSNETLSDFMGVFTAQEAHVSYYGDDIAQIDTIRIVPFILYNEAALESLHVSKKFQSFIPSEIDAVKIKFTPLYPTKLWLSADGDFGEIRGSYNMYDKKLRLILNPQEYFKQKYPTIYREFKDMDGELIYESSFE